MPLDVRERLLSDRHFFRTPDASCLEEAGRLADLGLIRIERVRYVRCFDVRDRNSGRRTWSRECQGIIELEPALDENAGQYRCPDCDAPARPSARRVCEGLRTFIQRDGVLTWVHHVLEDLALSPDSVAPGAFRVVHEDRSAIVAVFDYCDDVRFQPDGPDSNGRLAIVVNSADHGEPLARRRVAAVSLASLLDDRAALTRALTSLSDAEVAVRAGMAPYERARRMVGAAPAMLHVHQHQPGSRYVESVAAMTVNIAAPMAAEEARPYGEDDAGRRSEVYRRASDFPATDEEYERLKKETPLLVDFQRRRVFYKTHEIPARPIGRGRHLQNQPFAVLGLLALQPGRPMGEADLNEELEELDFLHDVEKVGVDLKHLRQRIVQPFEDALEGTDVSAAEVKGLVRIVRGMAQIELQVPGAVRVIGLPLPRNAGRMRTATGGSVAASRRGSGPGRA